MCINLKYANMYFDIDEIMQSKEIRYVGNDGYSHHGIPIKKLWFRRLIVKDLNQEIYHKIWAGQISDLFGRPLNDGDTNV